MAFNEAAMHLRHEVIKESKDNNAPLFDVWAQLPICCGLRVTGIWCELYHLVAREPTYAKLVMPSLEQRKELPAADDVVKPMEKLDCHMST